MKRTQKILAAALLLSPLALVHADYGQTSGNVTVQDVLNSGKNDQAVDLHGHLTQKLSDEKYQFSDGSGGYILVYIDKKDFPAGQAVSAETPVEIFGNLETHWFSKPDIEVKQIHVLPDTAAPVSATTPSSSPASPQ